MNCKNANQSLGFDIFSECNYNLHWSFSNFNRMLMVAGHIAQLPYSSKVLELGAGSSELENIVKTNFKRDDILFTKIDGDSQYESNNEITVLDITTSACMKYVQSKGPFDAVVFMEVIEHIDKSETQKWILNYIIYENLKKEGLLLITTPTPPFDGKYEDRVWPDDHKGELIFSEIYELVNESFKVSKAIGWSLEERDYDEVLRTDDVAKDVYMRLRGAFPESYIRATIAAISSVNANRQVLLVCKGRREQNGRFA